MPDHTLTTATITAVFTEGVRVHCGTVKDTFDDGRRLFLRSLLPFVKEVRPADRMQGGLALRATEAEIWLHPYLFRQVCSNGAIMAHALDSCCVELSEYATEDDAVKELQEAIAACCQEDVFTTALAEVRTSLNAQVDMFLTLAPLLSQLQDAGEEDLLVQIIEQFTASRDRSRFALMNAVTSVARDTRDPERRWRLEELGGGIGAGIAPRQPTDDLTMRRSLSELMSVR